MNERFRAGVAGRTDEEPYCDAPDLALSREVVAQAKPRI